MTRPLVRFNAPSDYYELWKSSIDDPEGFWGEKVEESISDIFWFKKCDSVFQREYPSFKWFVGGLTNAGYNCVDYKQSKYSDKIAYFHEAPELGISRSITYGELYSLVTRYSASLRNSGVGRGDRVLLFMPNSIEAVAILQACARIGAISSCVFAGFSPGALSDRIELTQPVVIFTQDFTVRRGRRIELKHNVDKALKLCPQAAEKVKWVFVHRVMPEEDIPVVNGRDLSLEEFQARGEGGDKGYVQVEANTPLFILCTSGTTAKPKPVVHVHGGFQIWSYWTAKWVYNLKPEDVIFNTADIGWIVGQSYLVFAPLLVGCSTILYEGAVNFPSPDVWWEIVERRKATMIWMSPTGARMLRSLGLEQVEKHDLRSVKRMVVAGEVLNPEVWSWLSKDVFKSKVPVFDHMWQTEIPGTMFGYSYGVSMPRVKPGSAGFPIPGILPEIVNEQEGKPCAPNEQGVLLLKEPVPGMTQTLWENPERYGSEYWETASFSKGRYNTGDSAYMDDEGYIWFCGRSDEVIKIAGHRIGPAEVENAIVSHPSVVEAAVSGVPDKIKGEVAAAFIVLNSEYQPSDQLREEIISHVRSTMGPLVIFGGVDFVSALPKTRSGKIMRRVLKKLWIGEELGDISTIETEASVDEIKDAISKFHRL
ncbi:AMP-binding protein [Chloroflexota bacterium]